MTGPRSGAPYGRGRIGGSPFERRCQIDAHHPVQERYRARPRTPPAPISCADLVVFLPGGSSKRLLAEHAREIAARIRPRDEIGKLRRKLVVEQIKDLESVDRRIASVNAEIKAAVAEAPTRLTKLYGLGAINSARILSEVGDVAGCHYAPSRFWIRR